MKGLSSWIVTVGLVFGLPAVASAQVPPVTVVDLIGPAGSSGQLTALSLGVPSLHGGLVDADMLRIYGEDANLGPYRLHCAVDETDGVLDCAEPQLLNLPPGSEPGGYWRVTPWGDMDLVVDASGGRLVVLDPSSSTVDQAVSLLPGGAELIAQPTAAASYQGRLFFSEGLVGGGVDFCGGCLSEPSRPGGVHSVARSFSGLPDVGGGEYSFGAYGTAREDIPAEATRALAVLDASAGDQSGGVIVAAASGGERARVQLWDYNPEAGDAPVLASAWGLPLGELSCDGQAAVLGQPVGLGLLPTSEGELGAVFVAAEAGIAMFSPEGNFLRWVFVAEDFELGAETVVQDVALNPDRSILFAIVTEPTTSGGKLLAWNARNILQGWHDRPAVNLRVGAGAAFEQIGDALKLACTGDTVEVLPGTYDESLEIVGQALTLRSVGDRTNPPSIRGGSTGSAVVDIRYVASPGVVLDGLILRDGAGGAELPWLWEEVSEDLSWFGGGVAIFEAEVDIRRTLISDSFAQAGGGIGAVSPRALRLSNVAIFDNTADTAAGGVGVWGTGLYPHPEVEFEFVTITANRSDSSLWGALFLYETWLDMHSSIVFGNGQTPYGQAETQGCVRYSNLHYSSAGDWPLEGDSDCWDGLTGGVIDSAPEFVAPEVQPPDLQLLPGSPSEDSGIPIYSALDMDGSRADQGVFGGPLGGWLVEVLPGQSYPSGVRCTTASAPDSRRAVALLVLLLALWGRGRSRQD